MDEKCTKYLFNGSGVDNFTPNPDHMWYMNTKITTAIGATSRQHKLAQNTI